MILICMYVALQAKLPDFFAHLKLAYQFATESVRHTKLGYCLTTFEMSLDQILNLQEEDILLAGTAQDATTVDFTINGCEGLKGVESASRQSEMMFEEKKEIDIVIEDVESKATMKQLDTSNVEYASDFGS